MHSAAGVPAVVRMSGSAEASAVLHRSARALLERLPELTDRVVALIQRQEPAYRALSVDPDALWEEVHRSLRYNVGSLLRPGELREAARRCTWRIGVDRAEAGLPLDALLHAFRLGGGAVWESLLETASRLDPEGMRLLVHVASDVWRFVDEHCALAATAYHRTERQLSWRRVNRLRLMAEALLEGSTRVADLPEIADALKLPEQGRYAVAVLSGGGRAATGTAASRLGTDRADPGRCSGPVEDPPGMRLLWHAVADSDTDLVIALLGDGGLKDLARALAPPADRRLGVSSVVEGLVAVGEARQLAEIALRSCAADGETVLLPEHLPAALVVSSPALGAALTQRVLGPVLRLEHADRDLLLDTLTVWLDCDESAQRAGVRLCCHRNTVLNRLRRFEKLTGRSLSRPNEMVELSLALKARTLLKV